MQRGADAAPYGAHIKIDGLIELFVGGLEDAAAVHATGAVELHVGLRPLHAGQHGFGVGDVEHLGVNVGVSDLPEPFGVEIGGVDHCTVFSAGEGGVARPMPCPAAVMRMRLPSKRIFAAVIVMRVSVVAGAR